MNRYLWYATALLLATPGQGHAQQGQDALRRIAAAELRAEAVGIPTSLLQRRVHEGAAKGVALGVVARAVEAELESLLRARELGTAGPELTAAAAALRAGVAPGDLRALLDATPETGRILATTVLAELVSAGIPSGQALGQVEAALSRGPEAVLALAGAAGQGFAARTGTVPEEDRRLGDAEMRRRLDPSLRPGDSVPEPGLNTGGNSGGGGKRVIVQTGPKRKH